MVPAILPCFQVLFDYLHQDIFRGQVSFTTLQALWIEVHLSTGFQLVSGTSHKEAGLLQAQFCLLRQPESSGKSSS